jgi:hypothetical protein
MGKLKIERINYMWSKILFFIVSVLIVVFVSLAIVRRAGADTMGGIKTTAGKVVHTSWMQDRAIKYGLITTFCVAQGTTGLIESAKYGGKYLSNSADDYHAYRYLQTASLIGTGWFCYATYQEQGKPWWAKTSRVMSAMCYSRDVGEMVYRWNVTGSPVNYSDKYSSNKKAIVLLKWDGNKGHFVDFYVSGTGKQGALIDASFAIAGFIFGRIGDIR